LASLPESIGNLQSLQILNLHDNQLSTLPKSIGKLNYLQKLNLEGNQLTSLPESIINLQSLQRLNLSYNQLFTLPESIGNLNSLQKLDLRDNQLRSLPESMWQLKNLEVIHLLGNPWEGEWKEMAKRDIPSIFEFCKQRATINIFISHTVNEFALYRIKDLAENLEHQPEINQVYFCEEDLWGNIDAWMEDTVPKSNLLIFIGTQQSIFNSRDCSNELFLARKHNIEVTPIKGIDASWEDLIKVGLSRELGFEFDENDFDKFCEKLYKYICEFKRGMDLLRKETDKIMENKSRLLSLIKDNLDTEVLNKIFSDKLPDFESLETQFRSKKITFIDFWRRLGDLLD